ncbi:Cyanobacterial and plant NDH-1 subunit O [Synechococcus sp. PCC 7502]|uniref:NAD(P)H-quinone oxidoreductase subunit O n=1 Tax=Synechococcus sp. PCC 7502 TaxID=1173263 RepID=UPI00029F92BF|nr:NAD(P)H-quinone oxidoreductase subunit O [Synechococcus sp. PCC 7502]AFY72416.1 Cyanobacterial and plant NDH-1 subunit O [Synechococcus sp. PCC 7502]
MELKKGALVTVIREKLEGSLEAQANDPRWSAYVFETKGEVVELRGEYVQVKFAAVPTPPIWLNKDQLQAE